MRKIEQQMNAAIRNAKVWSNGNTRVERDLNGMAVYLHNNHIATVDRQGNVTVNQATLYHWDTQTTKRRLRALGCNVYTRKGVVYLDDQPVNA